MTILYTRHGSQQEANSATESGKPAWLHQTSCHRCGGAGGSEAWRHTGWTCFQCGGSGKGAVKRDRLYTEEQLSKLNAVRDARRAKVEAARAVVREEAAAARRASAAGWTAANAASIECIRGAFAIAKDESYAKNALRRAIHAFDDGNSISWLDDALQIAVEVYDKAELAAASRHFGKVGERVNVEFTVTFCTSWQSDYGWPRVTTYLTVGATAEGNVVVYKGSHGFEKGEVVTAKWTIKEHSERDGTLQTVLARPTFPKA